MSIYGYCRISTAKQSIDRQIRNIKAEYPTAHIVQEAYTGTSIFRLEWLKLYRILKSGDMVVFDSVSRMSRNAEEVLQKRTEGIRYIQNENAVFLFCGLCRMDDHTVQPNPYNESRKVDRIIRQKEKSV